MAAKKRLIDANELITDIQGTASEVAMKAPYDAEWFTRMNDRQREIIEIINGQRIVDAVEVTRCKDCENAKKYCGGLYCKFYEQTMDEDDFCSHGERRTNERKAD